VTAAIGYNQGKPPVYLGSVRWGYYIDDKGKVSFLPAAPTFLAKPPPELGDAIARQNRIVKGLYPDDLLKKSPKLRIPEGAYLPEIKNLPIPKLPPAK
jgi:hypothetical protein